jgi:hypothetical protein
MPRNKKTETTDTAKITESCHEAPTARRPRKPKEALSVGNLSEVLGRMGEVLQSVEEEKPKPFVDTLPPLEDEPPKPQPEIAPDSLRLAKNFTEIVKACINFGWITRDEVEARLEQYRHQLPVLNRSSRASVKRSLDKDFNEILARSAW